MNEEVELLRQLVRNRCVNDGTGSASEEPNVDDLHAVLAGCGASLEILEPAPGRPSLVARWEGTDATAPSLMLLGHTDVVPASHADWSHDPFAAELEDGFVWGRGTLDMLGHVSTMALAFRDHVRAGSRGRGDVILALVADEEALGVNGMAALQSRHPDAVSADWVVTETGGVPSGPPEDRRLSVLAAEKGAWRISITIEGPSGHGSMPPIGTTSLERAAEVVTRIGRFSPRVIITDPWREFVHQGWSPAVQEPLLNPDVVDLVVDVLPDAAARTARALTRMTMVPTSVTTDASWNTVPGTVVVSVDVRSLSGQDHVDVLHAVTDALGELAEMTSIDIITGMPATATAAGGPLWELLGRAASRQVGPSRLIPTLAPGATDARFLRQRGSQAYGFGLMSDAFPAHEIPTMLHGVNERIDVQSLSMMRRLWSDVLELHAQGHHQGR